MSFIILKVWEFFQFNYFFIILSVFKIVISVTPVSANTASHIFANPNTLNKSIITLTDNANIKDVYKRQE